MVAHMAEERSSYLVSKALKSFMFASVLASLAQRLATMTDAIVVSNLIGPDAISAINVVTPITTLFPTVSILFGVGGSILAAKALGQRNANEANSVFTASLLGALITSILLAVVLFALETAVFSTWPSVFAHHSHQRCAYDFGLYVAKLRKDGRQPASGDGGGTVEHRTQSGAGCCLHQILWHGHCRLCMGYDYLFCLLDGRLSDSFPQFAQFVPVAV